MSEPTPRRSSRPRRQIPWVDVITTVAAIAPANSPTVSSAPAVVRMIW